MKPYSLRQLLIALVVFSISAIAYGDIDSLVKRQNSNAAPSTLSPKAHSFQQPSEGTPLDLLQGDWESTCEVIDNSSSSQEVLTIEGNTLGRVFGVASNTVCQAPPDILGIQIGDFRIGNEISSGVFEIDWSIDQATFTPLTPAGAAQLNAGGGFCGFRWEVEVTHDITSCLGSFVNHYSAFSVNNSRFVWADRTQDQPGTSPATRSTNLQSATSFNRD